MNTHALLLPHRLACGTAALLLALILPAAAQPKAAPKFDGAVALNQAYRQPMLAERITKSFTLIGQNVLKTRSKRHLEDSIREFDAALKELQATAPSAEIRENYELLEQLFNEFKELTSKPINLENARELAEQNEELVWISTKGAGLLQAYTKSARSNLIATASDMRTLTQRIAKLYLFRSWGIRSNVIADDLKKAEADYRVAIAKLLKAPQNTAQINSELALAETQYLFLKQGIDRLNARQTSSAELEYMSKACDNILEVMERVTKLYEGLKA
jgi:Type IV pili methyl-accepting chemotaxis transducer N-term